MFHAKRGPPRARPSSSAEKRPAAPVRSPIRIAAEGSRRTPSAGERLKEDVWTGLPGLLASLALHIVAVLLLAMFIVRERDVGAETVIDATWRAPARPRTSEIPAAPVKVESMQPARVAAVRTPAKTAPSPLAPAATVQVSVKPVDVTGLLAARDSQQREKILAAQEGSQSIERAIAGGLAWLSRQQQSAGNWRLHEGYPDAGYSNLRTDTGATALALLAFLGDGHTHRAGKHQPLVEKGLDWLKGVQQPDGNFHDHQELGRQTAFYAHAQATIVLCEAFAMTGDESLREPAERGVQFLLESQRQSTGGGWKYQPVHDKGDLSVTGWALMALHTGRAAGIEVPDEAFHEASLFLDSVQERSGASYKYEPDNPPSAVSLAMTAEGLLCRQFLGWPADHPPLVEGIEFLSAAPARPEWSGGRRNVYAWYYTAQVLHNAGGDTWPQWYGEAQQAIVSNQARSGSARGGKDTRGSWNPVDPSGEPLEYAAQAGRLYVTAMCLLILETPYRHARIGDGSGG